MLKYTVVAQGDPAKWAGVLGTHGHISQLCLKRLLLSWVVVTTGQFGTSKLKLRCASPASPRIGSSGGDLLSPCPASCAQLDVAPHALVWVAGWV